MEKERKPESVVREIRRRTRRKFSAEEKTALRQSVVSHAQGPILICVGRLAKAKAHRDLHFGQ